jgi:hypothetical protein
MSVSGKLALMICHFRFWDLRRVLASSTEKKDFFVKKIFFVSYPHEAKC